MCNMPAHYLIVIYDFNAHAQMLSIRTWSAKVIIITVWDHEEIIHGELTTEYITLTYAARRQ